MPLRPEWCGCETGLRREIAPPAVHRASDCTMEIPAPRAHRSGGRSPGRRCASHRFAGAGRADHQQIVPAGRRVSSARLAVSFPSLFQIGNVADIVGKLGDGRFKHLRTLHVIDEAISDGVAMISTPPGPRRFRPAGADNQPRCCSDAAMAAGSTPATAVTAHPTRARPSRHSSRPRSRQHTHRREKPKRDRKVVMASFLRQMSAGARLTVTRRNGHREPDGAQRRAHALLLSATALSARPTILNWPPVPSPICTCTSTSRAFDALKGDGIDMRDSHAGHPKRIFVPV